MRADRDRWEQAKAGKGRWGQEGAGQGKSGKLAHPYCPSLSLKNGKGRERDCELPLISAPRSKVQALPDAPMCTLAEDDDDQSGGTAGAGGWEAGWAQRPWEKGQEAA